MRSLTIAGQRLSDTDPTWVIAEIGNTHQGDLQTARALISLAATAGVSAVKFQRKHVAHLFTDALLRQPYDHEQSFGATYGAHKLALELRLDELEQCFHWASHEGVIPFATAFDENSADELMTIGIPAFKVHSGGAKDTPLLRYLSTLNRPLIISTGGCDADDVERIVQTVAPRTANFALLHCTAAYPVRDWSEHNLQAIVTLRERYPETVIGWSGHDSGIALAVMAYTLGARIIEKHVTLNRSMKGTDHAFSLEGPGITKLVRDLRRAEQAKGDGQKRAWPSEAPALAKMTRTVVASRDLPRGHRLHPEDLDLKIAGSGLPPYLFEDVVGFPLAKSVKQDEPMTFEHLKGAISA